MSAGDVQPGLVVHSTVEQLVGAYEVARDRIVLAYATLESAKEVFEASYLTNQGALGERFRLEASRYRRDEIDTDPAHALLCLRRSAWGVIVDRLELRRVMSVSSWEKLQAQLKDGTELPEITLDVVLGYARQSMRDLPKYLAEAVREVHAWLRPHRNESNGGYKTNKRFEIGERVVIPWVVDSGWTSKYRLQFSGYGPSVSQRLIALENVFNALDGRGQTAQSHKSLLEQAITSCPVGHGVGETEMFAFRCFRNGNLHLRFKRLDLLKRLNEIAGGQNFRSSESSGSGLAVI